MWWKRLPLCLWCWVVFGCWSGIADSIASSLKDADLAQQQQAVDLYTQALSYHHKPKQAIQYYQQAIHQFPTFPEAHQNIAILFDSLGEVEQSRQHHLFSIQYAKTTEFASYAWVNLLLQEMKMSTMYPQTYAQLHRWIDYMQQATNRCPNNTEAWFNLGLLQLKVGEEMQALASFQHILSLDTTHIRAYLNIGNYYFFQRQYGPAVIQYLQALKHALHVELVESTSSTTSTNDSMISFKHPIRLEIDKGHMSKNIGSRSSRKVDHISISVCNNLGQSYREANLFRNALYYFTYGYQLSIFYGELQGLQDDIAFSKTWLLQSMYTIQGMLNYWEHLEILETTLLRHIQFYQQLVNRVRRNQWDDDYYYYQQYLKPLYSVEDESALDPYTISLLHFGSVEVDLFLGHLACVHQVHRGFVLIPQYQSISLLVENDSVDGGTTKKKKVLRIGYLSYDWRDHPMGRLTAHIATTPSAQLSGNNRNAEVLEIETYCFMYGPNDESRIRDYVSNYCQHFYDLDRMKNNLEVAKFIQSLHIHILIDLTGHTFNGRVGIGLQRPADVVINYLGYPGPVGSQFGHMLPGGGGWQAATPPPHQAQDTSNEHIFDYTITDRYILPIEYQGKTQQYLQDEKMLLLPFSYQANVMPLSVLPYAADYFHPAVRDTFREKYADYFFEAAAAFKTTRNTSTTNSQQAASPSTTMWANICVFNTNKKFEPTSFHSFTNILQRSSRSRILLLDFTAESQAQLSLEFAMYGIPTTRFRFLTRRSWSMHLLRSGYVCDVAMDTFIYGAHTTASDLLFMGIPIVALRGYGVGHSKIPSRVASGIVQSVGHTEGSHGGNVADVLIQDTIQEYENVLVALTRQHVAHLDGQLGGSRRGRRKSMLQQLKSRLLAMTCKSAMFDKELMTSVLQHAYMVALDIRHLSTAAAQKEKNKKKNKFHIVLLRHNEAAEWQWMSSNSCQRDYGLLTKQLQATPTLPTVAATMRGMDRSTAWHWIHTPALHTANFIMKLCNNNNGTSWSSETKSILEQEVLQLDALLALYLRLLTSESLPMTRNGTFPVAITQQYQSLLSKIQDASRNASQVMVDVEKMLREEQDVPLLWIVAMQQQSPPGGLRVFAAPAVATTPFTPRESPLTPSMVQVDAYLRRRDIQGISGVLEAQLSQISRCSAMEVTTLLTKWTEVARHHPAAIVDTLVLLQSKYLASSSTIHAVTFMTKLSNFALQIFFTNNNAPPKTISTTTTTESRNSQLRLVRQLQASPILAFYLPTMAINASTVIDGKLCDGEAVLNMWYRFPWDVLEETLAIDLMREIIFPCIASHLLPTQLDQQGANQENTLHFNFHPALTSMFESAEAQPILKRLTTIINAFAYFHHKNMQFTPCNGNKELQESLQDCLMAFHCRSQHVGYVFQSLAFRLSPSDDRLLDLASYASTIYTDPSCTTERMSAWGNLHSPLAILRQHQRKVNTFQQVLQSHPNTLLSTGSIFQRNVELVGKKSSKKGTIAIYCYEYGQSWWPGWGPHSFHHLYPGGSSNASKGTAVGGSEEAVAYTAHELAKLGYMVYIFVDIAIEERGHQVCYEGEDGAAAMGCVVWMHYLDYHPFTLLPYLRHVSAATNTVAQQPFFDLFIAWRYAHSLTFGLHSAKQSYLWLHDLVPIASLPPLSSWISATATSTLQHGTLPRFAGMWVQSDFHASFINAEYQATYGQAISSKLFIVPNGIVLDQLPPADSSVNQNHIFVYGSAPNRGLQDVLEIWAEIQAAVPQAELHIYYGFTPTVDKQLSALFGGEQLYQTWRSYLLNLMQTLPNVHYHGAVDHVTLTNAYLQAGFLLHPTSYPETGCITMIRAMVAGAIPITSRYQISVLARLGGRFDLGPASPEHVLTPEIAQHPAKKAQWAREVYLPYVLQAVRRSSSELTQLRKDMMQQMRVQYAWSNTASIVTNFITRGD